MYVPVLSIPGPDTGFTLPFSTQRMRTFVLTLYNFAAILLNSTEVSAHKVCLSLKKVRKSGLAIQSLVNW